MNVNLASAQNGLLKLHFPEDPHFPEPNPMFV